MTPALVLLALRWLLALLLYAFLALLLLYLWRDVRASSTERSSLPQAYLQVERGPQAGSVFPLADETTIGRAADNLIHLREETVSAHHARLRFHEGAWLLEDLGSRNGTLVDGVRITHAVEISAGAKIHLGSVILHLQLGPDEGGSP